MSVFPVDRVDLVRWAYRTLAGPEAGTDFDWLPVDEIRHAKAMGQSPLV